MIGGTPQFVEDQRRGLYSYEALKSRLEESRFLRDGFRDLTGPLIRLQTMTPDELFMLLERLEEIHRVHYGYEQQLTVEMIAAFIQEYFRVVGANERVTPREIGRDFVTVLNLLQQNPGVTLEQVMGSEAFTPSVSAVSSDVDEDEDFAEFTL